MGVSADVDDIGCSGYGLIATHPVRFERQFESSYKETPKGEIA